MTNVEIWCAFCGNLSAYGCAHLLLLVVEIQSVVFLQELVDFWTIFVAK